jgi:two-component system, chemotaxis family, protein-glutamate methylesterase/glutaminase
MKTKGPIRVLVVEDSPVTALALKTILNSDPDITVIGIAQNGQEAVSLTHRMKPDVITMDVHLPILDGLEATKQIMASRATPILILSSSSFTSRTDKVFNAISYGALEVARKDDLLSPPGSKASDELVRKIKFLARIKVIHHPLGKMVIERGRVSADPGIAKDPERVVAIVGSTGAPKAIGDILKCLPKTFPCGILVLVHITHGFAEGFVKWLQGMCEIPVKLAVQGDPVLPGMVYVAPTELHMRVTKERTIDLKDDPPRSGLRPNGDILLESVAEHYGKNAIAVILTGMGRDGASGMRQVKLQGGKTIAQDEKSSTIFGMPKAAIDALAVDRILGLDRIADEMVRILKRESHVG